MPGGHAVDLGATHTVTVNVEFAAVTPARQPPCHTSALFSMLYCPCRFTTFESGLACLVSLLLYWGYQRLAAFQRWRTSRKAAPQQEQLLPAKVLLPYVCHYQHLSLIQDLAHACSLP